MVTNLNLNRRRALGRGCVDFEAAEPHACLEVALLDAESGDDRALHAGGVRTLC